MKRFLLPCLVLLATCAVAQDTLQLKKGPAGIFSLGVRSTVSMFDHSGSPGIGAGGQFRVQLAKRVNTEWFADVITNDLQGLGHRHDYHVGWSVMFYPLKGNDNFTKLFKPYILAGHCFDYSAISVNGAEGGSYHRFSAAVQAGIGTHINLTPRCDVTVIGQYMIHLGKDLHPEISEGKLTVEEHNGAGLEGHLLFTIGVNYKIADLW